MNGFHAVGFICMALHRDVRGEIYGVPGKCLPVSGKTVDAVASFYCYFKGFGVDSARYELRIGMSGSNITQ